MPGPTPRGTSRTTRAVSLMGAPPPRPVAAPSRAWGSGLLYLGIVVAWGLNYVFVRWGLLDSGPVWLAALRALVGGAGVAAFVLLTHRAGRLSPAERRDAVLIGIPTTGIFFGLWFYAAGSVPAGQAAVIIYTYPLWVALFSAAAFRTGVRASEAVAIALGFAGVVLVSEPWVRSAGAPPPLAVLELLVAAVAWAVGTVAFKARFTGPAVHEANLYQLLGGSVLLVLAGAAFEPHGVSGSPQLVGVLIWLGLVGTAFGYAAWYTLLDRYPAVTVSSYLFLVPVVALAASIALLGETLASVQVAGVACVVVSIYVTARTQATGGRVDGPPRSRDA